MAEAAFEAFVLPLLKQHRGSSGDLTLYRPAAWPQPLGAAAFAADSEAACVSRDAAVLLHHLVRLTAAELQQHGSSGAAGALGSRAAWVGEFGLAAAAGVPAGVLVRLLAGGSPGGAQPAAGDDDSDADSLCIPAAARVFAERCGAQHRGSHTAYATALSAQLQQLLAAAGSSGSPALLAAQQAEQLVSGLLAHPLAAAAAFLQQQLAAAAQLPAVAGGLTPLDPASAAGQPYLVAAGLQNAAASDGSSSSSPQQLWQQVQEVSSKVSALWHAVHAAVVLRSAAAAADDAVADGSATLLQLSHWRHQRPKVGGGPAPMAAAASGSCCCGIC